MSRILSPFLSRKSPYLIWRILFLVFGLALSQLIFPFVVYALPGLSVEISAEPSLGIAPLNDVDLTADVSGTATGDITYKFDCTNNGSWERTITTGSTSYTAANLCDYSSPGNYTAKVSVEREGLVFQGTTAIFVQSDSALSVNLSANPSSGPAPLNDVDLTADVSGTATGDITYKFDCTNNGSWERTITTGSTSYTAANLCDYSSPGNYTAKVSVERGSLIFQGTVTIVVHSGDVVLSITKQARNLSKNQSSFEDSIEAEPSDKIEFKIKVISQDVVTAEEVFVKDTLPSRLTYLGNLRVDGNSSSADILQGFLIGNFSPNQSRTIVFEAQVAPANEFDFGTTDLLNTVLAYNEKTAATGVLTVKVEKRGVAGAATAVSTGFFNPFSLSLILALLIGLILSYVMLLRFYTVRQILPNIFRAKADRDLKQVINRINKKER